VHGITLLLVIMMIKYVCPLMMWCQWVTSSF